MTLSQSLRALSIIAALGLQMGDLRAGERMEAIRVRNHLVCGVAADDPGFSQRLADGRFEGVEPDICRALAAALLGSAQRVQFRPVETVHQFLADLAIDIVFHRLTWTVTREAPGQLEFGPVVLYEVTADGAMEPLAPLLRTDDPDFSRAVRWTVFALIEAEQRGIDASNAMTLGARSGWPPADTGAALGLSGDWARRAVDQVGNHGEIFERHLGRGSALKRERGPNRLWRDGGLMLAPPVR